MQSPVWEGILNYTMRHLDRLQTGKQFHGVVWVLLGDIGAPECDLHAELFRWLVKAERSPIQRISIINHSRPKLSLVLTGRVDYYVYGLGHSGKAGDWEPDQYDYLEIDGYILTERLLVYKYDRLTITCADVEVVIPTERTLLWED
jgi:hypothetical protein